MAEGLKGMELIELMHRLLTHFAETDPQTRVRVDVTVSNSLNEAHLEIITGGKIFGFKLSPSDFPIHEPMITYVLKEVDRLRGQVSDE